MSKKKELAKYTRESPEIKDHHEYYVQYVCDDIVDLMNHAHEEGYKQCIKDEGIDND